MDVNFLINQIIHLKLYVLLLNKRIYLIKYEYDKKNIYEKNEISIIEIETIIKINKLQKDIIEKETQLIILLNE